MTAPLTLEEIEALSDAESAATPGPWCVHPNGTSVWQGERYDTEGMPLQSHLLNASVARLSDRFGVADVELTVEARNALPALLSMARRLVELQSALTYLHDLGVLANATSKILEDAREAGWTPPVKGESE